MLSVVLVSATASDNVALTSVSFAVGATPLGEVTTAPYEVNWDTTAYLNGGYQVTATATDTSGNTSGATVNQSSDDPPRLPELHGNRGGSCASAGSASCQVDPRALYALYTGPRDDAAARPQPRFASSGCRD